MNFKKTADTLIKGARTLERHFYTSSKILNEEYEKIFQSQWVCVGRSEEILEIGQFKTISIGNESVIILKDEKGIIKAHYNICRHRGTRLCNVKKGTFSKSIQCGYHGWSYALSGRLIGAPHMNSIESFDKNDYSLFPIHVKHWEGFIFINLSDEPEDFDQTFSPINNKFSNWNISDLKTLETKEYEVSGNWKLVIQNYCECYHCPILHPELASIHNYMGGKNDLFEGPFLGGYMNFNDDKNSISSNGELCCPPLPNLKKEDKNRVYYYSIFPNMLLSLHPDYVMYHIVWPISIDKSKVTCSWLFENNVINSSEYQPHKAIDFWDMTNKQDWYISKLSQLGIQSKKYSPAPYSGQESLLAAFDKYYKKKIND